MVWVWLSIAVVLLIVEIYTTNLVSIWCAIASGVLTILVAIFPKLPIPWQILIFVALSAVLLALTKKLVKRYHLRTGDRSTNLELFYEKTAIVVEEINNIKETGAVKINGLIWTARSENNDVIEKDAVVIFKKISGNKAIVKRKGE